MTLFLVIGGIGLTMLLLSLFVTDVFDAFDGLDALEVGDGLDGGVGWLSGPVIGGFLAAVGFGGALAQAGGMPTGLSVLVGLLAGVVAGWMAAKLSRFFMDMPTDPTPKTTDLFGQSGTVVTTIPEQGFGEVSLHHGGQLHKLNAQADEEIPVGRAVIVVEVTSSTAVKVADESSLFGTEG